LEDLQFVSSLSGCRIHFVIGMVDQKYVTLVFENNSFPNEILLFEGQCRAQQNSAYRLLLAGYILAFRDLELGCWRDDRFSFQADA
jgi:hypothetical protein